MKNKCLVCGEIHYCKESAARCGLFVISKEPKSLGKWIIATVKLIRFNIYFERLPEEE